MNGPSPYISLSEAGKASGYTAEYLRQLCVKGKLQGQKIGSSWVTTIESVNAFKLGQMPTAPTLPEIVGTSVFSYSKLQKLAGVAVSLIVFVPVFSNLFSLPDRIATLADKTNQVVVTTHATINEKIKDYIRRQIADDGMVSGTSTTPQVQAVVKEVKPQVLGINISDAEVLAAVKAIMFNETLSAELVAKFKGEKGEPGIPGQPGEPGTVGGTTVQYIPNSGSVFGTTAPTAPQGSQGTIGSASYLSARDFQTELLKVTSTSTLGNTNITGNLTVTGDLDLSGELALTGDATFTGDLLPGTDNVYDIGSSTARWNQMNVGPTGIIVRNDATDTAKVSLDFSGANARLITDAATPLQLTTGANVGINVLTNGRVGIGTTTATTDLQLNQSALGSAFEIRRFSDATPTGNLLKLTDSTGVTPFLVVTAEGNTSIDGDFTQNGGTDFTTSTGNLNFWNTNINLNATSPVLDLTSVSTLSINTVNNRPVTFGSGLVTVPNLSVTNSQLGAGTFNITSNATTETIFSVTGASLTSGTAIGKTLTANAGNGQITKGETIALTDSTVAGGGFTGIGITVTGAGTGSGNKYLLSLNPNVANNEVVFDNTGAFRPTTDVSSNSVTIGSPAFYWKNGYFDQITANNIAGVVAGGATSSTTWTIGSTEAGDVNEAIIFQRNSGSGNASLQWNAGAGDLRYLSVNYPFNNTYTVTDASIGTGINLYSGNLTNNTTGGTQKLLSLTNTGTGTTETGIYINNTGTGTTAFEIAGTWTTGILTNNNLIDAGTGSLTAGTTTIDNLILGGGYGSTGVTVSNTGNVSANGNLIVDGTITSGLINGQTISSTANFTGTVAVVTSVSTPSLISTGAVGITPAAGSNLNVTLSTTGDFVVNTDDLYVDTSTGNVGIGSATPAARLEVLGTAGLATETQVVQIDRDGSGVLLEWRRLSTGAGDRTGELRTDSDSSSIRFANAQEIYGQHSTGDLLFLTGSAQKWRITSTGHFLAATDNTLDIGASGATRPRTVYVGTSVVVPTLNATTALQLNGTSINTAGTLSNVAYLNAGNTFSAKQTVTGSLAAQNIVQFDNTSVTGYGPYISAGTAGGSYYSMYVADRLGNLQFYAQNAGIYAASIRGTTEVTSPAINTASGALTITPAAGSNLNVALSTTGDFAVNTTHFYVDTSTGYIGIGETSPDAKLHIVNDESTTTLGQKPNALVLEQLNASAAGIGSEIQFQGQGSTRALKTYAAITGSLQGSSGSGSFGDIIFSSKATQGATTLTERMVIKSDGDIGIGTTSPHASAILDLTSTTKGFLAPRMTTAERDLIGTPVAGLTIYNTTTNALNTYNGSIWLSGGASLSSLTAATGTNTIANVNHAQVWNWDSLTTETAMSMASSSATTGTVLNLATTGTAADNNQKVLNISSSGANAVGSKTTYGIYSTNTKTGSGTNIAGYFSASGGTNNYAAIFENGNVGIGTTSPVSKLAIAGDAGTDRIRIGTTNVLSIGEYRTDYGNSRLIESPGGLSIRTTGADVQMMINSSGNVGIGTITPNILGFASGSTVLTIKGSSAGRSGQIELASYDSILSNDTGFGSIGFANNTSTLGRIIAVTSGTSADAAHLTFLTATGGTLGERMRIDSTGNIGIGTTSPQNKLDVNGTFGVKAASIPESDGTGGVVSHSGGYTIHTFYTSGTFTPSSASSTVETLVVGGGGGGGAIHSGGGGGGGVVYEAAQAVTAGTPYAITVGAGGAGTCSSVTAGSNGGNSVFGSITAVGGGGGGSFDTAPGNGGSGGGAGGGSTGLPHSGGTGTVGQGNAGGNATTYANPYTGGGGGGAGSAGGNGIPGGGTSAGGNGVAYSISGSSVYYGGGGGGGGNYGASSPASTSTPGGLGGGGAGNYTLGGTPGTAYTGGGGGGGAGSASCTSHLTGGGAPGGSGIVIIKYPTPDGATTHPGYAFNVAANGNVGIGTEAPAYKLDVAGNMNVSGTVTSYGGMSAIGSSEGVSTSTSSVNVASIPITGLAANDRLFVVMEHSFATDDNRSPASTPTTGIFHSSNNAWVANSGELKPGAWSENSGVRWYAAAQFYMAPDPTSPTQITVNGWGRQAYVAATAPTIFGTQVSVTTPWTGSWSLVLNKGASAGLTNPNYAWRITVYKINGSADIAERYSSNEVLEPGDVVSFAGAGNKKVERASDDSVLAGIISTAPGITLGDGVGSSLGNNGLVFGQKESNEYPLALAGRVPVKVTDENGMPKVGDRLTVSKSRPGYAMKQTRPGQSIGIVLQDMMSEDTDVVLTFVKLGYWTPDGSTTRDSESLEVGDVVKLASDNTFVKTNGEGQVFGIVSSVLSSGQGTLSVKSKVESSGRLAVKVSEENGEIKIGDRVTLSNVLPGYAAKLVGSGNSIGVALENSEGDVDGKDTIEVMVSLAYHKINIAQDVNGDLVSLDDDINANGFSFINVRGIASASGKWSIAEDGTITATRLCLEDVCINKDQLRTLLEGIGQSSAQPSGDQNQGSGDGGGVVSGEEEGAPEGQGGSEQPGEEPPVEEGAPEGETQPEEEPIPEPEPEVVPEEEPAPEPEPTPEPEPQPTPEE